MTKITHLVIAAFVLVLSQVGGIGMAAYTHPNATPLPTSTEAPAGPVETQVAATIAAGQTGTATVEQAVKMTFTEGNVKATAQLVTEPKDFWNGQTGSQTQLTDWSLSPPDIQPYGWVFGQVDSGQTAYWIKAFPEEEVIEGFNWEAGSTVTLTILTGEQLLFQTTSVADYPDWDPLTTYVRFDLKALGYSDLERGDHIVMTDERTTRDLFVPLLYVDSINLESNTISGSGEPYSEITLVGIREEPAIVTVQANGSWTANFEELSPGTGGIAIQSDGDGNETWVNFYIDVPVPNPISNPDGDGNYTVIWNVTYLTNTYTLQEDDNAAFLTPTQYTGSGTFWPMSGKPLGKYYYRVKAANIWGDSGWSTVQSVSVSTGTSIADAHVLQGYPTLNRGNYTHMWAGYDTSLTPDGLIVRSLVRFDVSAIPAGTTINNAILRVYLVGYYDIPNTTRLVTPYRISSPWVESSVTWNTQPAFAEAYGSAPVPCGAWGWHSFDVTNLVRGWVNGTLPNNGIMLRSPETSGPNWRSFSTREGSNSPQLVITYGGSLTSVELSPGYGQDAASGSVVTYTHVLTNTGATTDTFALDAASSQGWPVSLLSVTGTLSLPLQLNAGLTTTFLISLSVPTAAISGTADIAVITATSQTSPTLSAIAIDTTMVKNVPRYVYLPLVLNRWPPIPDVPVLNPISNPDGDGYYTVIWNAAYLATAYTLQEDDNAAFSSPMTQYAGSGTYWLASGKPLGKYYYRVKAANIWGDSGWSTVQSVSVSTGTSIADAHVLQGYPTLNHGNYTQMWAGYDTSLTPDGLIVRSLVRFDVSAIPAGTTINNAILRVYLVDSWDVPGTTRILTTYRISSSWAESSVTWNTQPAFAEAYGSAPVPWGGNMWYSFDVTNLVRGWVNGTLPNNGIMLRSPETSGPNLRFFSTREGGNSPQLVITYGGSLTSVDTRLDGEGQ